MPADPNTSKLIENYEKQITNLDKQIANQQKIIENYEKMEKLHDEQMRLYEMIYKIAVITLEKDIARQKKKKAQEGAKA